jgi:hypothetical protein
VAIANRVKKKNGTFRLPDDALPPDYKLVYDGTPDASWSVVGPFISGDYTLNYRRGGANVSVSGWKSTAAQYEGSRFFAFPLAHTRIGEHDALFGSTWSNNKGPWVASWREPDGFTVRVTGLGASHEQTRALAEQSRELNHDEWARVVASVKKCAAPLP